MYKINLLNYFDETVKQQAKKIAVVDRDKTIDFETLQQRSKSLAIDLIEACKGEKNVPIAVFIPKSIESVIADIAITYSGNTYMNLDVKSPEIRINNILSLIQPRVIITNTSGMVQLVKANVTQHCINIDDILWDKTFDDNIIYSRLSSLIDTDPYCIINTSGSTGTPKGVVLNHRSFIDFTEWAIECLDLRNTEIVGSLSPLVFDIYSFELCMLMALSSTIVLIPDNLAAFPVKILELMQDQSVSFIFWVPTIMVNIANMRLLDEVKVPSLKTVWFAGEVFPTKQFNYWYTAKPNTKFINLYGPIEITLDCTYFVVNRKLADTEPIPIGFPCKNTDVLILNDLNTLAEVNEEGELCVRGTSLAMGYYKNPEKTAAAFVQNPLNTSYPELIYRTGDIVMKNENGEIIFKGRKDSLVKHLGYRIELGEIEHVIINVLKLVRNACVVYNFIKKEIVLYYESDNEISNTELRQRTATVLPKYMIPSRIERVEQMPRNTNGKIDRLYFNQLVNQG
jgi:amino acid adenylation domain-containing protein